MTNILRSMCFILPFTSLLTNAYELKECPPIQGNSPAEARQFIKCLDGNIETLERERVIWINKIVMDMEILEQDTGNTQLLPIIRRSLKHQDNYIEDSCRWRYLHKMPNSTKAAIAYKNCKIRLYERHIEDLKLGY
ncbi:MAG: hypothetical protein CMK64_14785 [Pseudoalteromonas sp.]|uniref:hypothetical protein n=1 Tax=Pseudoalteromonas phenolica TaxID=161398 RepID=UPI000C0B361B|nr:hypothetical protein [Pseudoalteromonas sp.]